MIRDGVVADAARLAEVHIASWQAAYAGLLPADYLAGLSTELAARTQRWRKVLAGDDIILVAESEDGRVTGFAHGGPSRDDDLGSMVGELYSMYLDPPLFRAGLGTRLLGELMDRMRLAGYRQMALWVMSGNRAARRFYERNGWEPDGTEAEQCLGLAVPAVRYRIDA